MNFVLQKCFSQLHETLFIEAATPALHVSATTAISYRIRRRFLRLLKKMATERGKKHRCLPFVLGPKKGTYLALTNRKRNKLLVTARMQIPSTEGKKGLNDG